MAVAESVTKMKTNQETQLLIKTNQKSTKDKNDLRGVIDIFTTFSDMLSYCQPIVIYSCHFFFHKENVSTSDSIY